MISIQCARDLSLNVRQTVGSDKTSTEMSMAVQYNANVNHDQVSENINPECLKSKICISSLETL